MSEDIICCPQCGGTGFTDEEHEPPCNYCFGNGSVSQDDYDNFLRQPIPVNYWWGNDGLMHEVDDD